ncbi:MAG: hypothetical protein Q8M16_05215, partial [Pirellulaceae bacterium]|nr:hypothetical protein [Pirellulaceae bacterium]
RCSEWFSPSGAMPPPVVSPSLELLDDVDLFQSLDLSGIDSAPDSGNLSFDDRPPVRAGQMASVRCRVCDTLQYVELKPGNAVKCEVCFAPFPLHPDGTVIQTKGKGNWTAPTSQKTVRDVSAEAVGGLAGKSTGSQDEIDDLIKDVRAEVQADFESLPPPHNERQRPDASRSGNDDDELTLQPLEEPRGNPRDHLYLGEEAKSLLFDQRDVPVDVDGDELVPLEELTPSPEPLDAILSEDDAFDTDANADALDDDLFVSLSNADLESPPATADKAIDWDSLDPMPLETLRPAPTPPTPDRPRGNPSSPGPPTGKSPPQFTPPVVAAPPVVAGTGSPPTANRPSGSLTQAWEQTETRAASSPGVNATSWGEWKDMAMPFTSPWLIGFGLLLIPLIYWAQLSWRLAVDDNTVFQRLVGYLSVLFSSAIVLPLWSAFLGVIANRATSVGQSGRLTGQAIFAQGCQFVIVLACWIPGAAVGTISLHYLVIGCLGAITMLPGGLYFVTSAIVANEMFSYNHPKVLRSLKVQVADWTFAAIVVVMLLLIGIVLAIATSYVETVGGILFAVFVIPASMVYAGTIGCLAKRVLQLDDDEPKARRW